ncbi:MAG: methyltransferase domain-containing protein [Acidimicrobiales bacterium]|jgi:SAM-dependent methyltransferase
MPAYERFAAFYDIVMDDPGPRAARVNDAIERFRPDAASLLELGCGTGSILARLTTRASLTGLDRSPEMLAIAARKVPGAHLVEGDMCSFDLGRRFDVIACVFDSINHLLDVTSWTSLIATVHRHLSDGGLFVVDVNTVGELRRLGDEPPWVYDFEGGTAIIDVGFAVDDDGVGLSDWDIRVFECIDGTRFELHHERIGELALPLARVRSLLADGFELLEEVDEDGLAATDDSVKAYYALRRVSAD